MTFICTLGSGDDDPDYDVRNRRHFALQVVGYDDISELIYSLFASLDVAPGGDWEFSFCLVETDASGSSFEHWSAATVAKFVSKEDRSKILKSLLKITRTLLRTVQPEAVYMHAFDPDQPQKALAKYLLIADVFKEQGYSVETVMTGGRYSWRMERAPDANA